MSKTQAENAHLKNNSFNVQLTKFEYDEIREEEFRKDEWTELNAYAAYLKAYCDKIGIEEKPESNGAVIKLKSFFGTYKFASGRILKIELDPKKLSREQKNRMLREVIEWIGIIGPSIQTSLEMLNVYGIHGVEIAFSTLLNELTSSLMNEYLPPALNAVTYTSPEILGRPKIQDTIRNISQNKLLFTSERAKVNIESLPVLFLLRMHYEILSALNKSEQNIIEMTTLKEQEKLGQREIDFALLRKIKRNRSYHIDFLLNPLYTHLIDSSLEMDFDDPETLDKVRREAYNNKSILDMLYLWDCFRGKKIPKPLIQEVLSGDYTFKPASKLYELWVLKILLRAISEATNQDWSLPPDYRDGGAIFCSKGYNNALTLVYNYEKMANQKFKPRFSLRPDFILLQKLLADSGSRMENSRVILIADAKYESEPSTSDYERMLAYILSFCWDKPEDTARGLLLFIGTQETVCDCFKDVYQRESPNVEIYSLCLRPEHDKMMKALSLIKQIVSDAVSSGKGTQE